MGALLISVVSVVATIGNNVGQVSGSRVFTLDEKGEQLAFFVRVHGATDNAIVFSPPVALRES